MLGEADRLDAGLSEHDGLTHYVDSNKALESRVEGTPVVALCGKEWVPWRNPKDFPLCPRCAEIYAQGDF